MLTPTVHAYNDMHDAKLFVDAAYGVLGAGATSPQGLPLSASVVEQPRHGSLTLDSDGAFRFTPQPGYAGNDAFVYQESDGHGFHRDGVARIAIVPEFRRRAERRDSLVGPRGRNDHRQRGERI